MTLGEKIQDLRRRGAMSQDVLAEKLEVSRQAVSKWERDEAVPETEKIVRIAQLFGVSTDYLLLDRDPQPKQSPRQPERPVMSADRVERFVRRHGYKAGYAMMAGGALICVFCLLIYFVWPAIGSGMFGAMQGDPFGAMMGESYIEFGDDVPDSVRAEIEAAIRGNASGYSGMLGSSWNSGMQWMEDSVNGALRAQAGIFLIGLLPGLALIAAGAFVVVKGKEMAQQGQTHNI